MAFLGAGASKCVGVPLMGQFADDVRASGFVPSDEIARFDAIHATCNQLSAVLGQSARNIEQLASFLDVLLLTNPKLEISAPDGPWSLEYARILVLDILRKLMHRNLAVMRTGTNWGGYNEMRGLIGMHAHHDLSIVTTNYDLHVELAAFSMNKRLFPGDRINAAICKPASDSIYASVTENGAIPYFKLHGSVNWFLTKADMLVIEHEIKATTQESTIKYQIGDGFSMPPNHDDGTLPLMAPPTVFKTDIHVILKDQWRLAVHAISQAERLWFFGYSFPESDTFMRFLIAAGVFNSPAIKQIVVVDPDPAVLLRAERTVFVGPALRNSLVLLPLQWEDVDPAHLMTKPAGELLWNHRSEVEKRTWIHETRRWLANTREATS